MNEPAGSSHYVRREEIARGGTGAIYRVHDLLLDRTLAMKIALRGAAGAAR